MRIAILLLNSGRGSGEVARQQARYLAPNGCRVFFMHPGIKDGVAGAVNTDIDLPLERFLVLPCGIDLDEFRSDRSSAAGAFFLDQARGQAGELA